MDNKLIEELKNGDEEKYKIFSLNGLITYAKIINNYDGDTADCLLIYNNNILRFKVRFLGYDSPEIKPPLNTPDRDNIIAKAKLAKSRLWCLCTKLDNNSIKSHNNILKILCSDFDKYGRLLITAFNSDYNDTLSFDSSINKIMIDEGFGYAYYGGTKIK